MQTMEYKGFNTQIMRAQRLEGNRVHDLPPGTPIEVYPVDCFEHPLESWLSGPGNYVVPVDSNWGLWFDWTRNDHMNTAILPTVKGMNPITGQRTKGLLLERYQNKCPIHNVEFMDGLFCKECGYKWPDQNYIAAPNTLWWDGFRTSDGKVRQFFFTEDMMRSIPEQVIGKEDTIPAFGFAFYSPKERRESPVRSFKCASSGDESFDYSWGMSESNKKTKTYTGKKCSKPLIVDCNQNVLRSCTFNVSNSCGDSQVSAYHASSELDVQSKGNVDIGTPTPSEKLEVGVGAGAEIRQQLSVDTIKLTEWNSKPDSVMRLYFVFTKQFEAIKAQGMIDLEGHTEGFINGLPVG